MHVRMETSCHRLKQWRRLPALISVPAALFSHSSDRRDGVRRTVAEVGQEETVLAELVARVVLVVADEAAISMSTMRGIHPTLGGYQIPRIYLEVSRWTERGILLMDMGGTNNRGATGLLPGMACERRICPKAFIETWLTKVQLGAKSFFTTKAS